MGSKVRCKIQDGTVQNSLGGLGSTTCGQDARRDARLDGAYARAVHPSCEHSGNDNRAARHNVREEHNNDLA